MKIPHFKGMNNLMIRLIPLFPYCALAMADTNKHKQKVTGGCKVEIVTTGMFFFGREVWELPFPKISF